MSENIMNTTEEVIVEAVEDANLPSIDMSWRKALLLGFSIVVVGGTIYLVKKNKVVGKLKAKFGKKEKQPKAEKAKKEK